MPEFMRFQELPLLGNVLGSSLGSKHNMEVASCLLQAVTLRRGDAIGSTVQTV